MKDHIIEAFLGLGCAGLIALFLLSMISIYKTATRSIVKEMMEEQETRFLELRKADREHLEQLLKLEKPGA